MHRAIPTGACTLPDLLLLLPMPQAVCIYQAKQEGGLVSSQGSIMPSSAESVHYR